jgi:hypothetical protein
MRTFVIILVAPPIVACSAALGQDTTPNVAPTTQGLSTPITSTTTNCMMSCNSQAANCQTRCFIPNVPGPPPSFSAPGSAAAVAPLFNADVNAACRMGCTSTQLSCQSGCALNSPSR